MSRIKEKKSLAKQELAFSRIQIEGLRNEVNRLNEVNRKLSEEQPAPVVEAKVDPREKERVELARQVESL